MRLIRGIHIWTLVLAGAAIQLSSCGSNSATTGSGGSGVAPSGQSGLASVALNPSSVAGGSSTQITVTMAEPAPASGATVLLTSSDPAAVPPPQLTVGAGQTTATATVPASAVTETKSVTLSASYNSSTATADLTILPPTAPFTVTLKPSTLTILQGKSATSTVTTKASSGFNSLLQLSASKEPVGATTSFVPSTIKTPGSRTSTLTLNLATSAQTGTYPMSVTATGGSTSESATLTLKVISGTTNPNATFKGCWYRQGGHRYQAVDISVGNPGTYPYNAVLYHGATCNPNDYADEFGFGQTFNFGGFGWTFWFTDFKDQTGTSALWYVGSDTSQCVNYAVAPNC